jgi:CRISPR-associated protein Csh2
LIAFHGIISAKRAQYTKLNCEDINLLQESLIKSIPLSATRSKIGQYPRLLIQVEYNDDGFFIGDLRRYIKCEPEEGLRDVDNVQLEMNPLIEELKKNRDKISKIYYWQDKELKPEFKELVEKAELSDKLEVINV